MKCSSCFHEWENGALILAVANWMTDQKRYGNFGMIKTKRGWNWEITFELLNFTLGLPCILNYMNNNQHDALFIFSLLSYHTATCLGRIIRR
jgi:hypothetical protein